MKRIDLVKVGCHEAERNVPRRVAMMDRYGATWHLLISSLVTETEDGCWEWQGARDRHGYGRLNRSLAHRVVWELVYGEPAPAKADDLELDHLCKNRCCCNPDHLEPVTQAENKRRSRKTHCCRGHRLDADNVYIDGRGYGSCRICRKFRKARWDAKQRREAAA